MAKPTETVLANLPKPAPGYTPSGMGFVTVTPTQVRRPWRSTLRTIFQAAVALAAMWGLIIQALGLPDWAWVSVSVAVAGGICRVMALPQVEVFLRRFAPFLSATPKE